MNLSDVLLNIGYLDNLNSRVASLVSNMLGPSHFLNFSWHCVIPYKWVLYDLSPTLLLLVGLFLGGGDVVIASLTLKSQGSTPRI